MKPTPRKPVERPCRGCGLYYQPQDVTDHFTKDSDCECCRGWGFHGDCQSECGECDGTGEIVTEYDPPEAHAGLCLACIDRAEAPPPYAIMRARRIPTLFEAVAS